MYQRTKGTFSLVLTNLRSFERSVSKKFPFFLFVDYLSCYFRFFPQNQTKITFHCGLMNAEGYNGLPFTVIYVFYVMTGVENNRKHN